MQYKKLLYIGFIFLVASCKDVYNPELKESDTQILIVEGYLNNGPGPHKVKLSYAQPFADEEQLIPALCESMYISDDSGNKVWLDYDGLGWYTTRQGEYIGVPGNTYQLYIRFDDGTEYESTPETMPQPITSYEIKGEYGLLESSSKDANGELLLSEIEGIFLNFKLNNVDTKSYVRVKTDYYTQYLSNNEQSPFASIFYCWELGNNNKYPSVQQSLAIEKGEYEIRDFNIGFLPYFYDPYANSNNDTLSAPVPIGWVSRFNVHNVTLSSFLFNQKIVEQLKANDYIFDPIPSQMRGNILCITNPNLPVSGLFEVSAVDYLFKAFRMSNGKSHEKKIDTIAFPAISDCTTDSIPPHWINTYKF